ncbi:unnamed protein product, partial [Ceratitis capitata]
PYPLTESLDEVNMFSSFNAFNSLQLQSHERLFAIVGNETKNKTTEKARVVNKDDPKRKEI